MSIEEYWEDFTSSEKDLFQKACRRLLKQTFIVRDRDEDNKRAYYFVSKRLDAVSQYFRYIGFDAVIDRENGVVMLKNLAESGEAGRLQSNRFALKKIESVVLCCLWTLYADRIRSGSLSRVILVPMIDLRFELEKYGLRDQIDKSTMTSILTLFSRFNLIDVNGKPGDPDCTIRLYPSLQFALEPEEFRRFAESARRRMMDSPEMIAGEDMEDDDETDDE